ncbi:MAG: NTP transferase domain-containing protein [Thermoguttaceae bacterium]|nr:NTP transferase domain-containing protein [Thermoguttaceae bacterium]
MTRRAIVLAAGKGTRMKSDLPKVLYPVAGRPIIDYVLDALAEAGVTEIVVVVGYRGDEVRRSLAGRVNIRFVEQTALLGTGHAVMCCRPALADVTGPIFVIAGDSPMLRGDSVKALFDEYDRRQKAGQPASAVLGTVSKENPFGMGRILRDAEGNFLGIVEERDATAEQKAITEINMSYYVFDAADLFRALDQVTTDNAQGEYYITDVPAILRKEGKRVEALKVLSPEECLGVNTTEDAARVEEELLKRPRG